MFTLYGVEVILKFELFLFELGIKTPMEFNENNLLFVFIYDVQSFRIVDSYFSIFIKYFWILCLK